MTLDVSRYVTLNVVDERRNLIKDLQTAIENSFQISNTYLLLHEILSETEVAEDVQGEAAHVPPKLALREDDAAVGA